LLQSIARRGFYKVQPADPQTPASAQTMTVGYGTAARDIAYRHAPAKTAGATGLFWLSGFMSDMGSTKATAVAQWAKGQGFGSTLFDYSGHGVSSGRFVDGTIGRWLEEASAVFTTVTTGPQVIIGSSMGGHIALVLLRKLAREAPEQAARVKGLVLIAPAWDMTEELMWKKFSGDARRAVIEDGAYHRPSAYAQPYTITRDLIEDGRRHLLARQPFDPGCPVIILQGLLDADVPAQHTRELLAFLDGRDIRLIEIPDGEHRLSRPEDLEKLFSAILELA
jgi:pimeloyl-ACP methyl ester carboxylesterase